MRIVVYRQVGQGIARLKIAVQLMILLHMMADAVDRALAARELVEVLVEEEASARAAEIPRHGQ